MYLYILPCLCPVNSPAQEGYQYFIYLSATSVYWSYILITYSSYDFLLLIIVIHLWG